MVNVWIVETFQNIACKLLKLFNRQIECLHQFVKLHFVDVFTDDLMVASIAYNINAAEVCHRREYGVWAVEQCHLALVVRFLRRNEEHMETSFVCGELISYFLRSFNHPEVECLCLYNKVVAVRNLFLNLRKFLTWESWNDTIHESGINATSFFKPFLESI